MEELTAIIGTVSGLAVGVRTVTEIIKQIIFAHATRHIHTYVWLLVSIGVGIVGGYLFDLQLLPRLTPLINNIVSGLVVGGVASIGHDLLTR